MWTNKQAELGSVTRLEEDFRAEIRIDRTGKIIKEISNLSHMTVTSSSIFAKLLMAASDVKNVIFHYFFFK